MSVQLRPFNKIYKLRELATYLSEVRIVKVHNVMFYNWTTHIPAEEDLTSGKVRVHVCICDT
jgi:hypothetical protein